MCASLLVDMEYYSDLLSLSESLENLPSALSQIIVDDDVVYDLFDFWWTL